MKKMFTTVSVLRQFDSDRETVVKTDFFEYVMKELVQQYNEEEFLRSCVFFSKKNLSTECNYEIYDKELLAIVECLKKWSSELRSVLKFRVLTNHKNLTYFTTTRKWIERQMRWVEKLSKFNFEIAYRSDKKETQSDILSGREQDISKEKDVRYTHWEVELLKFEQFVDNTMIVSLKIELMSNDQLSISIKRISKASSQSRSKKVSFNLKEEIISTRSTITLSLVRIEENDVEKEIFIENLWDMKKYKNITLKKLTRVVRENHVKFSTRLSVKIFIAKCSLNNWEELLYRDRKWASDSKSLRIRIVQHVHDFVLTEHLDK